MTVRIECGVLVRTSENKPAEYDGAGFYSGANPDEHDGILIEKLRHSFDSCNMLVGEAEVKIEENVEITDGSAANEVIYADIDITVDEIKPLYNKAVVKFTSDVKIFYNSTESKDDYVRTAKKISSTQIIDVEDLDENYDCVCRISLSSLKTDIDIDQYGDNKIINLDYIAQIELMAYKNSVHEAVIDAYAPKYDYSLVSDAVKLQRYKGIYREKQFVSDSITLEDASSETGEVMDAAGIIVINNSVINESVITISSSAELAIMIRSADGEIQNLDCSVPIKTDINAGELINGGSADISGALSNIEAKIESGKLSVKVTAGYECVVFENESRSIVKSVIIDADKAKSAVRDSQMVIYYPGKGENLWSIAKKYDSQVSKIMKFNKCDSHNVADKKIIIIPRA
jgi:LysM repeat protein